MLQLDETSQANILNRYGLNPILKPDPTHPWESFAAFNGNIIKHEGKYFLLYRAMGEEIVWRDKKLRLSTIGICDSTDGYHFSNRRQLITPELPWELYGVEDPRVTLIDGKFYIFYTALSSYPPNAGSIKVGVAVSSDLKTVSEKHLVTPFNAKAMALFPEKINGEYVVILSVNTDNPPVRVGIAKFKDLATMRDMNFWQEWYRNLESHAVPLFRVNSDQVEVGAPPVKTPHGWLFIYSCIKHYWSDSPLKNFRIEAVLLDAENPAKIVGRIEPPLLTPERPYEMEGQTPKIVFPEGAMFYQDKLRVYYGAADSSCALAETDLDKLFHRFEINASSVFRAEKFPHNPILEPIPEHDWEAKAVFNPGVIAIDDKIYILYRALSKNNLSTLGLAVSHDGYFIDERLGEPVYTLRSPFEKPKHAGAGGGVEDVRLTRMGEIIYVCYTAYDGELPRLAFTSISVTDFLKRRWSWSEIKIISLPNTMDKNGCLFPEKIDGQYVFFHRVEPNIVLDTVADLEFKTKSYLCFKGVILPRTRNWDEVKIGICGPPIKTFAGWLQLYHGISRIDRHYRLGAMLLDLNNPIKVIARTPYPILEPEFLFEKEGVVANVVFSCGHAVLDHTVFLYYGGADKVVCGATFNLDELIDYLIRTTTKKYLRSFLF